MHAGVGYVDLSENSFYQLTEINSEQFEEILLLIFTQVSIQQYQQFVAHI